METPRMEGERIGPVGVREDAGGDDVETVAG
jgi:hypothetical protein